jgi:hypothetical protein
MNDLLIAILIGLVAGTIDVVPMIIQKMDKTSCLSAFVHYFVLGLIIPFVSVDIAPWIKGAGIAFLMSIPVMIIVFSKERKAIIPMSIFSLVLGAGIGIVGAIFIG